MKHILVVREKTGDLVRFPVPRAMYERALVGMPVRKKAGEPWPTMSAAPPKPLGDGEFRALMETLARGWNEGDAKMAAECFTADAVYVEPPDKQVYRGREQLYRFFGGDAGRKQAMRMIWHHLVFDEETQIGAGEFTFEYGGQVHGMVIVRIRDGKIGNWREYWYESPLDWKQFTKENPF